MSLWIPNTGQARAAAADVGIETISPVTLALNSPFIFGTSGAAYAQQFQVLKTGNLTDIWLAVLSIAGTWGSTDGVINVQIREGGGAANYFPSTTLVAATTITLTGTEASTWVRKTGLSIPLTAGKLYWLCVGDTDGGATNFATMLRSAGSTGAGALVGGGATNDGWAANGTSVLAACACAMKIAGIMYSGALGTATASNASSVLVRGHKFTPIERCALAGMRLVGTPSWPTANWVLNIFAAATPPNGTPLKVITLAAQASAARNVLPIYWLFDPADHFTLQRAVTYRIVWTPNAATAFPSKVVSYAGLDDDLRSQFGGGAGALAHTIDSGAGTAWTDDADSVSNCPLVTVPASAPVVVG